MASLSGQIDGSASRQENKAALTAKYQVGYLSGELLFNPVHLSLA
jgi:hypothetical protein